MTQLVIFDMDGVLVDSEDAMAQMTVRALEKWGIHPSAEDFKPFRGMGDRAYVGCVSEKYGVPYEEGMKTEAYRLFCENARELVRVMPWTVPLLGELDRRNIPYSVASAADRIKVESNLACISRTCDDFASCVTGADVEKLKPAPDTFPARRRACRISSAIVYRLRGLPFRRPRRKGGGDVRRGGDHLLHKGGAYRSRRGHGHGRSYRSSVGA